MNQASVIEVVKYRTACWCGPTSGYCVDCEYTPKPQPYTSGYLYKSIYFQLITVDYLCLEVDGQHSCGSMFYAWVSDSIEIEVESVKIMVEEIDKLMSSQEVTS